MTQSLKDIIISSVISIAITIVFGYYFLYVGEKHREPTFYVDPVRTMIIDKTNAADAPLQLLKPNHDTINADVSSVYFYFFNQGLETIKRENVYSTLKVKLDTGTEILYYKILKTSRRVTGIDVSKDTIDNSLAINFNALEKDDGFVGQIIYEGPKEAQLWMEGGIDGVHEFKSELVSVSPTYLLAALFIFLITAYIFLLLSKRSSPKAVPKFLFFFSALPVLYLLLMLYKTEWFVDHKVPETLRIEHNQKQTQTEIFNLSAWFK